jgi:hypothetical protein
MLVSKPPVTWVRVVSGLDSLHSMIFPVIAMRTKALLLWEPVNERFALKYFRFHFQVVASGRMRRSAIAVRVKHSALCLPMLPLFRRQAHSFPSLDRDRFLPQSGSDRRGELLPPRVASGRCFPS